MIVRDDNYLIGLFQSEGGGRSKFVADEETWLNNNFGDLQKSLFCNGSEKYYLLAGTYSGEPVIED